MLEDIEKSCVDFKPNYDETMEEPITLPSKFPLLLCGNNSGIAVGMSSDLVSHNFTEVSSAINYCIDHPDCTIADLMKFIQGPDFPTGGVILNGEDLLDIYTIGRGAVKMRAHYDVTTKEGKTTIIFHDLPYGVEIDSGVKEPLRKLVLDDGYEFFENIFVKKVGDRKFDIEITLSKGTNVNKALDILFTKTRLADTVKINNTVIIDGEPVLLNLKQLIQYWINYRSKIIQRIATNDLKKTDHKLTITLGLQKCMSNIDKLINLIRNSDSSVAAKKGIMLEFNLNEIQANAVLDMRLAKLSRLDITELNNEQKKLEEQKARYLSIVQNEEERFKIIKSDLNEIKKILGPDERLTEIAFTNTEKIKDEVLTKKNWLLYKDGWHDVGNDAVVDKNLLECLYAYNPADVKAYDKDGNMGPVEEIVNPCGAFVKTKADYVVTVTAKGNIKLSLIQDYRWGKKSERVCKLKENDKVVFVSVAAKNDTILIYGGEDRILRLAIKDLSITGKNTTGVKTGFDNVTYAGISNSDDDLLLTVTKGKQGKLCSIKDFSIDSRGNKGQALNEGVKWVKILGSNRDCIYLIPALGKNVIMVPRTKLSIKSRTAIGASLTTREIIDVI